MKFPSRRYFLGHSFFIFYKAEEVPGRGLFAVLRLYAPLKAYFDKTWPLPDIEKIR